MSGVLYIPLSHIEAHRGTEKEDGWANEGTNEYQVLDGRSYQKDIYPFKLSAKPTQKKTTAKNVRLERTGVEGETSPHDQTDLSKLEIHHTATWNRGKNKTNQRRTKTSVQSTGGEMG